MSHGSTPRWGCAIIDSTLVSDSTPLTLSVDLELAGLRAQRKISQLATKPQTDLGTHDVEISTLLSALKLARDPINIRHLANPGTISGCFRVLKAAVDECESAGTQSPLSYEYGYFCLKLLVTCLNVCLMERYGQLDPALAGCERNHHLAPHVLISIALPVVLNEQLRLLESGSDCDWVLGLSGSAISSQHSLIPKPEISALLNILWNHRKFLIAASGLSGLLFLFSRYVSRERDPVNTGEGVLQARLYEITLRSLLVAKESERQVMLHIIDTHVCYDGWTETPKHLDAEDSRVILTAFIERLSDDRNPKSFIARDPSIMLRIVALSIDEGTQDLIPEAIRCTLKYCWIALSALESADEVGSFAQVLFGGLRNLIEPRPPFPLMPSIQQEILATVRDGDLLDWTASILIRLKPVTVVPVAPTLQFMLNYFALLEKMVSRSEMERWFLYYVPDWCKVNRFLLTATYSTVDNPSIGHRKHHEKCLETWTNIAHLLSINSGIQKYSSRKCYNKRCPSAQLVIGAGFQCDGCARAWYCDGVCQAVGWKLGGDTVPHQEVCRPYASVALR